MKAYNANGFKIHASLPRLWVESTAMFLPSIHRRECWGSRNVMT